MNDRLELLSPLSPEECVRRLTEAIDVWKFLGSGWRGSRPVTGRLKGQEFRLRKRINYNNSFQTLLTMTMEPSGHGTRIQGQFGMHPFTRVFFGIWIGFVTLFAAIFAVVTLVSTLSPPSPARHVDWMLPIIPLLMLAFGFGLIRFGRYLARDEAPYLTKFLCATLEAVDKSPKLLDD